jgi:hypothetical protein
MNCDKHRTLPKPKRQGSGPICYGGLPTIIAPDLVQNIGSYISGPDPAANWRCNCCHGLLLHSPWLSARKSSYADWADKLA